MTLGNCHAFWRLNRRERNQVPAISLLDGPHIYGKRLKKEARVYAGRALSSFISTLLFIPMMSLVLYGSSEPVFPLEAP